MKYIPDVDKISSPFWYSLLTRINENIKKTEVLWPRSRSRLRLISQVKIVPKEFTDKHGDPLVPDLPNEEEIYLDKGYYTKGNDAHP